MKKHTIVLAVIAMMFAFSACQKDGVYNPKQKISEVYDEYSRSTVYQDYPEYNSTYSQPKSLSETWTWDKNLLMKITYPSSYGDNYVDFKYEGKRLSKATTNDGTIITYAYDGSKIDKINIEDDDFTGTYAYTYKGNKVSRIDITLNYTDDWGEYDKIHQLALPAVVCDMLAQTENEMKQKGTKATTRTVTVDFEWSGNNASKIKLIQKNEGQTWFTATSTCTYDNKLNPYYNAPMSFSYMDISTDAFSKNNLTKVVTTSKYTWSGEETTNETNYTYYYDGKFPAKQIRENTEVRYSEYYGTVTSKRNQVTYFVYK
jgi:hypothetical protein